MSKSKTISFYVEGRPRPGGSKVSWLHPTTKRMITTDAGGKPTYEWKKDVKAEARLHFKAPLRGAIAIVVYFDITRPRSHYRTGKHAGKLKPNAPKYPTKRPDTTKLLRPVEDCLTGVAWLDDSQVIRQLCEKRYADSYGMHMFIEELE